MRTSIDQISLDQTDFWDAALGEAGGADVYYRRGYLRALERRGEGRAVLLRARDGARFGLHVFLIRRLSDLPFAGGDEGVDLVSPYGYAGPIVSSPRDAAWFETLWRGAASELGAVSEFIRFHPLLATHAPFAGRAWVARVSETVTMDIRENLENGLGATCAKNLRWAQKKGVETLFGGVALLPRFQALYDATMDRRGAAGYYRFDGDYFDALADGLGDDFWVGLATHGGRDAAAGLFLRHGRYLHYHLGGSDHAMRSLCATNQLLFDAAVRARRTRASRSFILEAAWGRTIPFFGLRRDSLTAARLLRRTYCLR
ncbi:MAG: aminoacyltransferase [Deltaproteobacteria bacterium]|nr:aminoacyltransferase [Deltaproteobacteria bacterium]